MLGQLTLKYVGRLQQALMSNAELDANMLSNVSL